MIGTLHAYDVMGIVHIEAAVQHFFGLRMSAAAEALDLARHFRGSGVVVRFIEYMDVGNRNDWNPALVVPSQELRDAIAQDFPLRPVAGAYRGEVAERGQGAQLNGAPIRASDVRTLPDENPAMFLDIVRGVIGDPAVEVAYASRDVRPAFASTRLDSEAMLAIEDGKETTFLWLIAQKPR